MNGYYLGGDVSKGYCDFILMDESHRIVEKNFQLDDTAQGHEILIKKLISYLQEDSQTIIYAGFESTGGYEDNWIHSLSILSAGYNVKVTRLNPKGVSHHHKANLNRNITDPISARNIAEYLIAYAAKINYNQQHPLKEARRLYNHIEMLIKQNTQLLNCLQSEVYISNPSLIRYWQKGISKWLLSVIVKWPTANALSKASVKEIAEIHYVSKKRALELKKNSGESISSSASEVIGITIQSLATEIIQRRETIKKLKKALYSLLQLPDADIVKSAPGISDYGAYGILLEIDGVGRFPSSKKICSNFGTHPENKESGDGSYGFHMSKKGSSRMRRILYLAVMSAIQWDAMFKELYENYLEKGRAKKDALCILMHKLLRIIYGMLKSRKKYDPMINKNHRDQYLKKQEQNKTACKKVTQARRLQEHDKLAPISRRQAKKRKIQMEEHTAGTKVDETILNTRKSIVYPQNMEQKWK